MDKRVVPNPKYQKFHWEKNYGPIPDGWQFITIGSLFTERTERSSDTELYPLHSFTIERGVTAKTDRYERSFLLKNKEENEFAVVYPRDFVFNPMNLRFGAVSYSRIQKPVSVSAYYNILIPDENKIDCAFMEALLKSHQALDVFNKIAIGSLLEKKRIHLSILEKTYVPLPPVDEQKRIGEILSMWNAGIEQTEKLNSVHPETINLLK